jgi:hypothetical protein
MRATVHAMVHTEFLAHERQNELRRELAERRLARVLRDAAARCRRYMFGILPVRKACCC